MSILKTVLVDILRNYEMILVERGDREINHLRIPLSIQANSAITGIVSSSEMKPVRCYVQDCVTLEEKEPIFVQKTQCHNQP